MKFMKCFPTAVLLLGALTAAAHGQATPFRQVPAQVGNQPSAVTAAAAARGAQAGYVAGANQGAAYANAANYYGNSSGGAGGFLSGTADVINANGNYQIQQQDARLKFEDWQQARLQTKRSTIEEWEWEQQHRPTWLDQKAQLESANLQVARNSPPLADVYSGKSLNVLLKAVQQGKNSGIPGPPVPVDQAMLKKIRLTDGQTSTGVGLLKDGGKLQWPVALSGPDYQQSRQKIDDLMVKAAQQAAGTSGIDPATVTGLESAVNGLAATVLDQTKSDKLTPTKAVQGKRYVNELRDTIRLLQDPSVTAYVTGQRTPEGRTVPEVVDNVLGRGLTFAPSTNGDEQAYVAFYNAMLSYDSGMQAYAASRSQPPGP
jgi:hypothetical protein